MKTYCFILQSAGGIADEQVFLLMCSLTDRQVKVGRKKPLAFSSESSSPSVMPVPRFPPAAYATLPQAPNKLTTGQEALPPSPGQFVSGQFGKSSSTLGHFSAPPWGSVARLNNS